MNKLQASQLTILLCISSAFSLMCSVWTFTLEQIIGTALSIAIQMLLCIPVLLLTKRGDSIASHCSHHKLLPLLFALYFVARGGRSVVQLWNVSGSLSLPFQNPILSAVLIALVCLYTSSLGIKTLARSSTMVFGILLFTLAVMFLGGYRSIHLQHLAFSPDTTIVQSTLRHLSLADELPMLVILLCFLREKPVKSTLRFFGIALLLWTFVLFLGITVLGRFMKDAPYPFFMIANVSQPFRSQRADALYLVLFVLLCVTRLTMFTTLAAHLLGQAFPNLRFRSIICLLATLCIAAALGFFQIPLGWYCILPIVALGVLVPVWFLRRKQPAQKGASA